MTRNKILFNITLMLLAGVIFSSSSCKDDTDDDPQNNPVQELKGTMMFHIHNYIDIEEVFLYGAPYFTSIEGRQIKLNMGQFYISGIELVKLDGSIYTVPGKILLKVQDDETYNVGEVPAGNYKSVRFKIGLDAATNASNPSSSTDDVLNRPAMWFDNTAQPGGYVFFNAQGMIDTTAAANGSGTDIQPFTFKIGTNSHYVQVVMGDKNFTVSPNQTGFVHLLADYSILFSNLNLHDPAQLNVTTPGDNAGWVADTVASNISRIFRYEE